MNISFETLKKLVQQGQNIETNSQNIKNGDIFILCASTLEKSKKFLAQAAEKKANYVLCDVLYKELADNYSIPFVFSDDLASDLGILASIAYKTDKNPIKIAAITGTNGKTTVCALVEHILLKKGLRIGVLGTVSYRFANTILDANLTTPDCLSLHRLLAKMYDENISHLLMEASSHALEQNRLAGINISTAAISNVTQDHLDYHKNMENYFAAKKLLFTKQEYTNKTSVINLDDSYCERLVTELINPIGYTLSKEKALAHKDICRILLGEVQKLDKTGIQINCTFEQQTWKINSPLIGDFNASNILAAQAIAFSFGCSKEDMLTLNDFSGVCGRLEKVQNKKNLSIFVDYAHTPDALINVQKTLKALNFNRLITVFGCGGDRDNSKRALMAKAVEDFSDIAIITSDNPRTENPAQIISMIQAGFSGKSDTIIFEEENRYLAIKKAIELMNENDVLLIAGKGHEDYQIIGTTKHSFSDQKAVLEAIEEI